MTGASIHVPFTLYKPIWISSNRVSDARMIKDEFDDDDGNDEDDLMI